ncbi:MAG: alpha/beta hydrolase [Pseudomonadota bacterium]
MKLYAKRVGQGDPRLLLHCSLGVSDMLLPLVRALPAAENILVDLPGHGRSPEWRDAVRDGDYPSVTIAGAIAELSGPTHIVGHSYSGAVALRLAVERPDLVSRLTLIEPVLFAATRGSAAYADYEDIFAPFAKAWAQGDREGAARAFIGLWGFGVPWEETPTAQRRAIVDRIHLIPAAAGFLERDETGILSHLSKISCPVDLVQGSDSPTIVSSILDVLETDLPNASRHVIEGAGHMVPITHARAVAEALAKV